MDIVGVEVGGGPPLFCFTLGHGEDPHQVTWERGFRVVRPLSASGTKDDLESRGATKHRLVTDTDAGWVRDVPGLRVDAVDGGTALFEILVPGAGDDLLAQALQRGHVIEFTPVRPTLSEIYREVTA